MKTFCDENRNLVMCELTFGFGHHDAPTDRSAGADGMFANIHDDPMAACKKDK